MRRVNLPAVPLKLRKMRHSLGSDKPYALTQHSRKGSTCSYAFFLSARGLQQASDTHRFAPNHRLSESTFMLPSPSKPLYIILLILTYKQSVVNIFLLCHAIEIKQSRINYCIGIIKAAAVPAADNHYFLSTFD